VCKKESTTIFGESTKATMQSMVSILIKNTQLSNANNQLMVDILREEGKTQHDYR
jgi:hypothetical protein